MLKPGRLLPASLLFVALAVAGLMIWTSAERPLTPLEGILFQLVSLGSGLFSSFIFGVRSSRESAKDLVSAHSRPAFRRVLGLYTGLIQVRTVIAEAREVSQSSGSPPPAVLNTLEAIIAVHLTNVHYALEDWRDLVPEDVAEVIQRLRRAGQAERIGTLGEPDE